MRVDFDRVAVAVAPRFEKIFADPSVDHGMDDFIASVGGSAALATASGTLAASFSADSNAMQAVTSLTSELASSPRTQEAVMVLMAAHPGQDIGALAGDIVGKNWARPEIGKQAEATGQELMSGIIAGQDFSNVAKVVEQRFDGLITDTARLAAWGKRLTELNGGKAPDLSRATDLYIERAWSDARIVAFIDAILANPVVREESANALGEILVVDSISKELRSDATALLNDPDLHSASITVIQDLFATDPNAKEINKGIHDVALSPKMIAAGKRLLQLAENDPAVAAIVSRHLGRLASEPSLHQALNDFLDRW